MEVRDSNSRALGAPREFLSTIFIFEEVKSYDIYRNQRKNRHKAGSFFGAGEETLTLDLFLGKEAL